MPTTVQQLYGELWGKPSPKFDDTLKLSLHPRTPSILYDMFGELGVGPGHLVLDIGCRDAEHAVELVKRFGCRAVAVDPIPLHMEWAEKKISEAEMEDRITLKQAGIEAIPLDDAAVDFIWCRDMLNHVDLPAGLSECARILKPGGAMFIYHTFATDLLEPNEARRLFQSMSIVPANMSPANFEETAHVCGFEITHWDRIDSEWREASLEKGSADLPDSLLAISRMRRLEPELVERFGRDFYEASWGSEVWGIYQILGKLCPTVYVLKKG